MRPFSSYFRGIAVSAWLVLTGILSIISVSAQNPVRYEAVQLREDFTILRNVLEDAHIGLYRYADKQSMDAAFDETLKSLASPLSELEFLKRIAALLALIRDDHTYALPSNAYWNRLTGGRSTNAPPIGLFPFYVKNLDDRIFISHNNSRDATIPVGSEILSVDGRPAKSVIETLEKYLPTSGFATSFRPRHLEQYHVNQEFNFFCIYYTLFVATPESFALEIKRPGADKAELTRVTALPQAELWANFRSRYNNTNDWLMARQLPLKFTLLSSNTALWQLSSFHDWQWNRQGLKPVPEIAKVFQALRSNRVEHLILDLRGNEGGSMVGAVEVLSGLAVEPFQIYRYKELKGYEFQKYSAYLRESAPRFAESLVERTPEHTFRFKTSLPDETWSRPLPPAPTNYMGKLYVLIDGTTGSAAAQLATLLRVNRRDAIFVGEECGGDMEGPVSGSYLAMQLPHTGIRVDVPLMKKVLNLNGYPYQRGRGVIPDHEVKWTAQDLIERRDPALNQAQSLIRSK